MLGERLAFLRRRENISQKELGDKLDISHYTISSYEKGRSEPSDKVKVRLARYFHVSLDYLVGLVDEPYPYDRDKGVLALPPDLPPEVGEFLREALERWKEREDGSFPSTKK